MTALTPLSEHYFFNGKQTRYAIDSAVLQQTAQFSLYLPPRALQGYAVPTVYCLPDGQLLPTELAFFGAQRFAVHWGIALVMVDSALYALPAFDTFLADELPNGLAQHFPLDKAKSVLGQGNGADKALQLAFTRADYAAVSAFSPTIDASAWLVNAPRKCPILIDQSGVHTQTAIADNMQAFLAQARAQAWPIQYNRRAHYDDSHYFMATFIDSHIEFHAEAFDL